MLTAGSRKSRCHGITAEELLLLYIREILYRGVRLNTNVSIQQKRDQLLSNIRQLKSCAVAFSAGVDSTVVAKAAQLAVGEDAVAVTGSSASLAAGELDEARTLAKRIGIRHIVLETNEFAQGDYIRNAPDRCFHCKTELYTEIQKLQPELGFQYVLNGANVDDQGDYRPGLKAARDFAVRSPLVECGFTKQDVRDLATHWELPVADKPATPCLSSRVAYGEQVTPARLEMIDRAEQYLKQHGFSICRVRYHNGDLARIEVPIDQIPALFATPFHAQMAQHLRELGFKVVTVDLEGFRSGNLNQLINIANV